jgi:translation initiation factor IF-3
MEAAQNLVQTLLGTDNSTQRKKEETTINHLKQLQLSVSVHNEEMEIKLSSLSIFLQLVPVTKIIR